MHRIYLYFVNEHRSRWPLLGLYFFTKRQNCRPVQIGSICRQQFECVSEIEICFWKGRKHCGKRRKWWFSAFSPFPTMLSKVFFLRVVKSWDCVVELKKKKDGRYGGH